MLCVTTCLWNSNGFSLPASRCYSESWVEKLHAGFRRNLTVPFRFVCFTDEERHFSRGVEQEPLTAEVPDYGSFIEPFRLNEPMIAVGLDTVIVGNIDHMARHCLSASKIAVPRDPYQPHRCINGVVLSPAGQRRVWDEWNGENDMEWMRRQDTVFIDDLWPGEVLSLKFHDIRRKGLQGARIVYMHGRPKQPELGHLPWVKEHWST